MSALVTLRVAVRSLSRAPGFATLAVGVLGLGVAVVVVMFGVVRTCFSAPPLRDGDRLVLIAFHDLPRGWLNERATVDDVARWRREQSSFEDVAGFYDGTVVLSGDGPAERHGGGYVTGPFFEVAREEALLGRLLAAGDARPGASPAVVLGERLWRDRFGASPDVVGRALRVNGETATVVGVARGAFDVPAGAALWIADRTPEGAPARVSGSFFLGLGRLRPGVGRAAAQADLAAVQARAAERDPRLAGLVPDVGPVGLMVMGRDDERFMNALFASVFLVLLLAVANVAGLLLVRGAGRTHEAAIRRALGAGRVRLALEMLAESAVVGALAALVGVTLAAAGFEALRRLLPGSIPIDVPSWWRFDVDGPTAAFAVASALAGALAAGAWPAFRVSGVSLDPLLREGVRDTGLSTGRLVRWLVVAEIALSCALLTTAGVLARTAFQRARGDLGAELGGVVGGRIGMPAAGYPEERRSAFAERLEARLAAVPGVEAAAVVDAPPGAGAGSEPYALPDRTYGSAAEYPVARVIRGGPGFFRVFRVPTREGRTFDGRDRRDALPVAVVNEAFARAVSPGASAVGMRLRLEPDDPASSWITVVGVVGDVQHANDLDAWKIPPAVYVPFSQRPARYFTAVVRGSGDPLGYAAPLRDAVAVLDPDLAVYWLRTAEATRRVQAGGLVLISGMFGVFALVTMFLAASGIYGVLAYSVAQGARDIAIRRALGASAGHVVSAIARRSAWQLALGLGLGLVLSPIMGAALGAAMGGSVHAPVVYASVVAVLAVAIGAATVVPLRRALALAPAQALRHT